MTAAEFIATFPAFKAENVNTVQRTINLAAKHVSTRLWGGFYEEGLGLATAFMLEVNKTAGSDTGDVTTKQVGSVSITRSADLMRRSQDIPWMANAYGRRFYALAIRFGFGGTAV